MPPDEHPKGHLSEEDARLLVAQILRGRDKKVDPTTVDSSEEAAPEAIPVIEKDEAKKHVPLRSELQEIVATGDVRMVGHTSSGLFVSTEKLLEDLRTIVAIERDLVVDPADVKAQMHAYEQAKAASAGKVITDQQFQQFSKFASLGGHADLNEIVKLLKVLGKKGYACLLEYTVDGVPVPGGYIYGFAESFRTSKQFPTLGLQTILAPPADVQALIDDKENVMTNWRTGVPVNFKRLKDQGFLIPDRLVDESGPTDLQSPRQWGGGSALKLAVACAGEEKDKTLMMLNVGFLQKINAVLGVGLPNVASILYNAEFLDFSGYYRQAVNSVILKGGEVEEEVAKIRWGVFVGLITDAIARLESEHGVLKGKGGWDVDKIHRQGNFIGTITHPQMADYAKQALKQLITAL